MFQELHLELGTFETIPKLKLSVQNYQNIEGLLFNIVLMKDKTKMVDGKAWP